jgi:NTP pyrophosphatase (non-canonical NTP hydrolase)
MELDLEYLSDISIPVLSGFARVEPRKWGIDSILLELLTEIGSLGRALTIWEGYRYGSKSRHKMGDELSDVFFVLVKLAQNLRIELPPILETIKIRSPEEAYFQLMQSAIEIVKIKNDISLQLPLVQKIIQEIIALVGGLAEYYQFSLIRVHAEEMRLAILWQKIFFDAKGKKAKHFVFLRKVIWYLIALQHERIVNHM